MTTSFLPAWRADGNDGFTARNADADYDYEDYDYDDYDSDNYDSGEYDDDYERQIPAYDEPMERTKFDVTGFEIRRLKGNTANGMKRAGEKT